MRGSVSEHQKSRRSPVFHPRTELSGIGVTRGAIAISFLLAMLTVAPVSAEEASLGHARPDEADLRHFFKCSKLATKRILSFDEATSCSRAYMRIKLSFVPGVGLDEFDRLSSQEKAAVNIVGYRRYMEWRSQNAANVEAPTTAPLSSSVIAED